MLIHYKEVRLFSIPKPKDQVNVNVDCQMYNFKLDFSSE